jgi:precorrin-2/cobalt-factor-2 C20-methyltransferase
MKKGKFFGIGVGPGSAGMISFAAVQALQEVDAIFVPKARHVQESVARQCLNGVDLADDRFIEVVYNMDSDRAVTGQHYKQLAQQIVTELDAGKSVAYLTIGDSLTYSTYNYLLSALLEIVPDLDHKTFAGITSYCALASRFDWPLGHGKERMLVLPCPDEMTDLKRDIEHHDVIALIKIGRRLPSVLALLKQMEILEHCVFASRLGLPGEVVCSNLAELEDGDSLGYLSTMLISKLSKKQRMAVAIESNVAIDTAQEGSVIQFSGAMRKEVRI